MSESLLAESITQNKRFKKIGERSLHSKASSSNQMMRLQTEPQKDNLGQLQSQIDQLLRKKHQMPTPRLKRPKESKNKTTKAINDINTETKALRNEISELKSLLQPKNEMKSVESKLEVILRELQIKRHQESSRTESINQPPPVYMPPPPPYNYYPYPQHYTPPLKTKYRSRKYNEPFDDSESQQMYPKKKSNQTVRPRKIVDRKEHVRRRLRKIFYSVTFVCFIKGQAKKLSKVRKNNLKKFWLQGFERQIINIKNWLLESQKYALSIILQKANLDFSFFEAGTSKKIRDQKEYMIMQIVHFGIKKLKENSTSQKISAFSEILTYLCRKGSFAIARFWTAHEMQQICISEYYGFFRIDESLEKFLIGVLVFIKIFIFNMFLQPHKFDERQFPKYKDPLASNMQIISSVYYLLVKQVLNEYLQEKRNEKLYKQGNWLEVKKEFIVECSEPLVFGEGFPENKQFISGLHNEKKIGSLKNIVYWEECKENIKSIIEKLHEEMVLKMKLMRKNLKYKVYN